MLPGAEVVWCGRRGRELGDYHDSYHDALRHKNRGGKRRDFLGDKF